MFDEKEIAGLPNPYQKLHIYLVNGFVPEEDEAALGESFIGRWIEGGNSFLFFAEPSYEKMDPLVRGCPDLSLLDKRRFSYEEWQGTALDLVRVEDFLIVPPWSNAQAGNREIRIVVDPGVVFGTGTHPTTRDCLRALLQLRKQMRFRSVLDLGTGTGILSLAAALPGAEQVLAVDMNPLYVKTALRNVSLNGVDGAIKVIQGDATAFLSGDADLILANVHSDLLIRLLELDDFSQKERLILSGLLRGQARNIEARLSRFHLELVRLWEYEETWCTMLVKGNTQGHKFNHENTKRGKHESRDWSDFLSLFLDFVVSRLMN
jgi:ribosomal protein L11 methyltransferase